jgi:hypothetical protein
MTSFSGLASHFAVGAQYQKLDFVAKWGEVLIFRPFLSFQWEISSVLN